MTTVVDAPVTETVLPIACEGEQLLGILHRPSASPAADVGVVVVVGGPQYRAGSHRQFVRLARALMRAGHPVLRFDVRGMGDSTGSLHDFERVSADLGAAIDALAQAAPSVSRVVLWGLCDGASAALLYLDQWRDARVAGLCLANPWVRTVDSHARTTLRHYYLRRVMQPEFWRKLVRGGVAAHALGELGGHLRRARAQSAPAAQLPYHQRMARAFSSFGGPALLLLSEDDYTAREFVDRTRNEPVWRAALDRPSTRRAEIAAADHTFSNPAHQLEVEEVTVRWLRSSFVAS